MVYKILLVNKLDSTRVPGPGSKRTGLVALAWARERSQILSGRDISRSALILIASHFRTMA